MGTSTLHNVSRHSWLRFLHSIKVRDSTLKPEEYARARAVVSQSLGKRREAEEARAERRQKARWQNELQNEVRQLLAADWRATQSGTGSFGTLKASVRKILEFFGI